MFSHPHQVDLVGIAEAPLHISNQGIILEAPIDLMAVWLSDQIVTIPPGLTLPPHARFHTSMPNSSALKTMACVPKEGAIH